MISRNELFVFCGVHIDERGANKWREIACIPLFVAIA